MISIILAKTLSGLERLWGEGAGRFIPLSPFLRPAELPDARHGTMLHCLMYLSANAAAALMKGTH
jgi:hypothetical protein